MSAEITSSAYLKDGDEYSRITTVLGSIPAPALTYWFKEKTAQGAILAMQAGKSTDDAFKFAMSAADEASRKSREDGTLIHELIRTINEGKDVDLSLVQDESVVKKIKSWQKFRIENNVKTLCSERTLFSDKYKIAGTLDHMGEINGVLGVDDFKTGEVYDKAFVQLAAYNAMLNENNIVSDPIQLRVIQLMEDEVKVHTTETFFKKGGKNKNQECHIPTPGELFLVFRCALFNYRFSILKTGKWEGLVKDFKDLAKDTDALLRALAA